MFNFQDYHAGDYYCVASNVGGNASFIVSVEVQGKLEVRDNSVHSHVICNSGTSLNWALSGQGSKVRFSEVSGLWRILRIRSMRNV